MWSTDYPHTGTDWPNSRVTIERVFAGVSAPEVRAMLHDNVKRLYGLDEIPDRLREQVVERDRLCRFPECPKRAERCDLDHRIPHARGGPTCGCNLAAACRRHHRAKTFAGWTYESPIPGTYHWTSPTGRRWIVDPHGTRRMHEVSADSDADPPEE